MKTFEELRKLNVNDKIEKKGGLSYLSWAHAVDELLIADDGATWEFPEPKQYGKTMMVYSSVTAFGKTRKMQLPVMDNRNNAIENPDARKISDATMRCLTKNIACFGIGLYIYAGEDVPGDDVPAEKPKTESGYVKQVSAPAGNGNEPNKYIIPFGKFKNRTIEEVAEKDPNGLKGYCEFLERSAAEKGKPIVGGVETFLTKAYEILDTMIQMGMFDEQGNLDAKL